MISKLWCLGIPLLVVACHSGKIAGTVTVDSSCAGQVTTGTASNPTELYEVVEVDVTTSHGPTGQQMPVGPRDKVPFTIEGCGTTTAKVIQATKIKRQPGAPTLPPPATAPSVTQGSSR
jgi:hypothetical protein